jgi:AraC-like DNA-binding protein/quercetin dioxygenase-like cupin family protein
MKDKSFLKKLKETSEYKEINVERDPDNLTDDKLELYPRNKAFVFQKKLFGLEKSKILVMKHASTIDVIPHAHDFIEIQYVSSGSTTQMINGEKIVLKEGNLTIFNKNTIHSIEKATKNDTMYFIFIHDDIFNTRFFSLISNNNPFAKFLYKSLNGCTGYSNYMLVNEMSSDIIELLNKIIFEARTKQLDRENLLIAYLIVLLIKLGRQEKIIGLNDLKNVSTKKGHLLEIDKYLQTNYRHATLKDAAKTLNLHPNYMCRVVKEITGKTFGDLLTDIRMEIAENLLTLTNMPIESIALEIGYVNSTYLYKLFKKRMNLTPSQYRNENRIEYDG